MSAAAFDPFAPAPTAASGLAQTYGQAIVDRAMRRRVHATSHPDTYEVIGLPSMSDALPSYTVKLEGRRHTCVCVPFNTYHKVCSHIVAVILAKRGVITMTPAVAPSPPQESRVETPGRETPVTPLRLASGEGVAPSLPGPSLPDLPYLPTPADPIFGSPPLPTWIRRLRPHQWDAVLEICDAFTRCNLVFLDAPTGSGKSLIAELVRRLMHMRATYICSTKTLQDQFSRDFSYASVLKGRSNYIPVLGGGGVTCADCVLAAGQCMWCPFIDDCSYRIAKATAFDSEIAVLNTAKFLYEANYAGMDDKRLVIVDECDTLESEVMGFKELSISQARTRSLAIDRPRHVTKPEDWAEWLSDVVSPAIRKALSNLPTGVSVKVIRERKTLASLLRQVDELAGEVADGNWIYDGYAAGKTVFRPVRVNRFGHDIVWQYGAKWMLMSATIISPEEMAESLGWTGDYETVSCEMTFPLANRQIHVAPVANMRNAEKETSWPIMASAIDAVCDLHPDERILVHTVSYALAAYLFEHMTETGRQVITYTEGKDRDKALSSFLHTPSAVLLAPSLDRGVSLDDEACRVVVVAKVPFPNLGDKQVAARLHSDGGQLWYSVATVRSLVQSTGRHVRSATDYGVSYVLDAQFVSNTLKKSRSLLPKWWLDALDMGFPTKTLLARTVA